MVNHLSDIEYQRSEGTIVRTRSSTTTGETESGESLVHEANFVVSYDIGTGCYDRSGSASTQIGERETPSVSSRVK
jgi:hypothetical protein